MKHTVEELLIEATAANILLEISAGGPGSGRHAGAYNKLAQVADLKSQKAYKLSAISHKSPGAHAIAWKAHMGAAEAHLKAKDYLEKHKGVDSYGRATYLGDPSAHGAIAKQHYALAEGENKLHYRRGDEL